MVTQLPSMLNKKKVSAGVLRVVGALGVELVECANRLRRVNKVQQHESQLLEDLALIIETTGGEVLDEVNRYSQQVLPFTDLE